MHPRLRTALKLFALSFLLFSAAIFFGKGKPCSFAVLSGSFSLVLAGIYALSTVD